MKYIKFIEGNRVEVVKQYRTRTQFEWVLTIFMKDSDIETIHIYEIFHLTKKSAFNEAERVIKYAPKPRIERII